MSKALLKKSLAFVKSGRSDEKQPSKGKESYEGKKVKAKGHAGGSTGAKSLVTPGEDVSIKNKKVLYSKRRILKAKVIKTVAESVVQEKRELCLTPAQLAQEKRRIRLQRRKKRLVTKSKQETNPFSILNIPHLAPSS